MKETMGGCVFIIIISDVIHMFLLMQTAPKIAFEMSQLRQRALYVELSGCPALYCGHISRAHSVQQIAYFTRCCVFSMFLNVSALY